MIVFRYDKTFEGLLTAVFDAYSRRSFPERLLAETEPEPMFASEIYTVITQEDKSVRVWRALEKKVSREVRNMIMYVWFSELSGSDELIFRYLRKVFDSSKFVSADFTDKDVLEMHKLAMKVSREREHLLQFVRFQKAADGTFFAPVAPKYNALPLAVNHFQDRFADQKWLIYDTKRRYGYYYDLDRVQEVTMADDSHLLSGKLDSTLLAEDEKLFQELWKSYFNALAIKERINPKLQRQQMPRRFWKYLTEKQ